MIANDYIAAILPRLTVNAAINLRHAATDPSPLNPDNTHGKGRTFTGMGKYTTLAVIGVENNMISLGLAERRPPWDWAYITPLGREVSRYLADHWDEVVHLLRDADEERRMRDKRRLDKFMAKPINPI